MKPKAMNVDVKDVKTDLFSFKTVIANDLSDIKTSIVQLNANITNTQNALRKEMSTAFLNNLLAKYLKNYIKFFYKI